MLVLHSRISLLLLQRGRYLFNAYCIFLWKNVIESRAKHKKCWKISEVWDDGLPTFQLDRWSSDPGATPACIHILISINNNNVSGKLIVGISTEQCQGNGGLRISY
ncbi:hypothetical protein Y032_0398g713 [Ancylostoma ceylanicum]|uniref:Uncharacterized protein n=1 Tax=Ancylostoma ceylanicum TaxID=53326 RepID=A0A016RS69_9BILA|nr:hypothetical protein Y032_0398g713 [Ancylostoma ceylanicum]